MLTYKIQNITNTLPFNAQTLSINIDGNLTVLTPNAFAFTSTITTELRLFQQKGFISIQETRESINPNNINPPKPTKTKPVENNSSKEEKIVQKKTTTKTTSSRSSSKTKNTKPKNSTDYDKD